MRWFRRRARPDNPPASASRSGDETPARTGLGPTGAPNPTGPPKSRAVDGAAARYPELLTRAAGYSWRLLLVGVAIGALGWLVLELRLIVVPTVVALILATLLVPPASWLRARGWPSMLATWAVLLLAAGLLVGVGALLAPPMADQLDDLGAEAESGVERVKDWLVEGPLDFSEDDLQRTVDSVVDQLRTGSTGLAGRAMTGIYIAFETVAGALLALVLLFFFVKDGDRMSRAFVGLAPAESRARTAAFGRRAWAALSAYVRGVAVIGLVNATVIGVGLVVIGVPLALPLAVITFLSAFFPLVGAVVAGGLAALIALVSGGVAQALLVTGLVVAVQQIEGDVLAPVVMGRALRLHPVVVLLALTTGAVLGGVLGAFLSVPVAGVISAVVDEARNGPHARVTPSGGPPLQ